MENVVLTIHLILAVLLTGVVLLQRSEGGGLGMGGGGGGGGVMTGRQAANALTRLTWIFGIAIFCTSIALAVIAASNVSSNSLMDQLGVPAGRQESTTPSLPTYAPPPSTSGDPLTPPTPGAAAPESNAPASDAPAATAPAASEPAAAPADALTPPAGDAVTPPAVESQGEAAPATEAPAATEPAAEAPAAEAPATDAPAADAPAEQPAPAN